MLLITGTTKELQGELNEFTNVLIHAESHMRKTIAENVQVAMCEFSATLIVKLISNHANVLGCTTQCILLTLVY